MNTTIIYILIAINIVGYIVMCTDKIKSIYQWWRISENTLYLIALLGGVFGIWLGMQWPMYHKAGKKAFRIGIPLIALIWIAMVVYLFAK